MLLKLLLLSPLILLGIQACSVLMVSLISAGKLVFNASASLRQIRRSRRKDNRQGLPRQITDYNNAPGQGNFEPVLPVDLCVTPCYADNPSSMSDISMDSLEQMKTSDDADIIYDKNIVDAVKEEYHRQEELDSISLNASSVGQI